MLKHPSKNIEELFDKTAIVFEESEIRKFAKANSLEWHFSIAETAEFKDSLLILNFNPKAEEAKSYLVQTHLPETTFDLKKWQKMKPLLEKHFDMFTLDSIVDSYYCPLRSAEESQITESDLDICMPLFKDLLKELSPRQIISFSNELEDYFNRKELLSDIVHLEIEIGKRKIKATKACIKNGRKKVAIAFLPDKDVTMSKENRERLWEFVAKK